MITRFSSVFFVEGLFDISKKLSKGSKDASKKNYFLYININFILLS